MLSEDIKLFFVEFDENYTHKIICEQLKKRYFKNLVSNPDDATIIWIFDPYIINIKNKILRDKKVIQTFDYFDNKELEYEYIKFLLKKEKYVDFFHTFSFASRRQVSAIFDKKVIYKTSIFADKDKFISFHNEFNIDKLKVKLQIPKGKFVLGNNVYKVDTPTQSKKFVYEKGVDLLAKYINSRSPDKTFVMLFDEQNQSLIDFLEKRNFEYKHIKNPTPTERFDFYHCIDLFVNTSRFDGDSLNLLELAQMKVPTISFNSGNAKSILSKKSVGKDNNIHTLIPDVEETYQKSKSFSEIRFFKEIEKMFSLLIGD